MAFESLTCLGRALQPHREAVAAELIRQTKLTIDGLDTDPELGDLLAASITENVVTVVHVLANGVDPVTVNPPSTAIVYARRLARGGVPLTALLRAYGFGQSRLLEVSIGRILDAGGPDQMAQIADMMSFGAAYLDHVTKEVGAVYEAERDRWLNSRHAARREWVRRLLEEADPDVAAAEAALGYRLDQRHLAVELWTTPPCTVAETTRALEQAAQLLTQAVEVIDPVLALPAGDHELRLWLPVRREFPDLSDLRLDLTQARLPVRMALGAADSGLRGFRRSARTAARGKTLAQSAGSNAPAAVAFEEIAPFALLVDEPRELAVFATRVLGPLARDDAKTAVLRETLEMFLAENGSYARTATRLLMHRNTVQYRIQQITRKYGLDLTGDTFDLRYALGICRWHRTVALLPPG
ncbi:helix-turn-helix domain-containing protein [Nocardia sp. XZ_19_231]|uniref:PucR family transcriptional regulator n=1 Tax=Nocardia sp. XZ_19_231 TaxID=2769252 RepID=UPI001890743A